MIPTLDILSSLISFDTTSSKSNLAMIDFIREFLGRRGIESVLIYNEDKTKAGIIARIGKAGDGGIILSGHTDVVPVTGQSWSGNPFEMEDKGDFLFGRGAADMKAFIACTLAMVDEYKKSEFKKPVYLVFSYDEEIGCLGALPLANKIKELGYAPDFAIIGEPTEMKLATFHKGISSVVTSVSGVEGHSSNPEKGANAIFAAATLIGFIEAIQEKYKSMQDERFYPSYSTFNVGLVEGGTARNIIPKDCCFAWEFRPIPEAKFEDVMEQFEHAALSLIDKEKAKGISLRIENEVKSKVPGLVASGEYINQVMRVLGSNESIGVSFATEAGIFNNSGIPSVVLGPGSIEQAHKPNEFIAKSQISACLDFLGRLGEFLR